MKASKEYKKVLKDHLETLRREFPEREWLKEMVTGEVERLGMTFHEFFQPYTFARALHDKRSPLLEAIALVTEERMAMEKSKADTSRRLA